MLIVGKEQCDYQMISKRTKACEITPEVKAQVEKRDGYCCIFCGAPGRGEAHFINRSQGGLGIPQNLLTVCRKCHLLLDNSEMSNAYKQVAREYLMSKYPDWNEESLVYNKWKDFKY